MEAEQTDQETVREVRLEGPSLLIVGGLLIATMAGSFFVGRWYERRTRPAAPIAGLADNPLGNVVTAEQQEARDVDADADFFDTTEGKTEEPSRQANRPTTAPEAGNDPVPAGGASNLVAGDYYVQVFAGRDEAAAAGFVSRLEAEGHPVGMQLERQGNDSLYKVRVGGFPDQDAAREAARALQQAGYSGAWVTKAN